ncbi:Flagellar basal body L-ring protein [Melioribacter roseus P3M-2]|uniref:Flagellar L-ring protein n=1 Tax=Melioribacter roseus (strain DSM 23840 / JCM 17771 / VKM B-2668 / P3M-2) TaxID=1191523 RepID=I7A2F3_MELRP|nr:flagellar basal body L-ring protein FlgH [Melioribacter roseus]AFN75388.1 Flagellar basal body L-ring protein [Melioribacter roseus P3M-2]
MKNLTLFLLIMTAGVFGQNMRQNSLYSLFADNKAVAIGDAITIIVMESSQASNNAETTTGRTSSIGGNFSGNMDSAPLPKADGSLGTTNSFEGAGSTKTTGLVRTKISALVDTVYANGNMLITGSRKIVINGEEQIIKIKGIVRPSDILPDNSVYSYNISEAEITFEGSGMIDRSQSPGWLTKLFHWLF